MNIFVFDPNPELSALWLDDVRKNKMITETCQILSTAMNILVPNHKYDVMASFNPKHGSNVWARASLDNFKWLLTYVRHLNNQRGLNSDGSRHAAFPVLIQAEGFAFEHRDAFPAVYLTPFSNNAARQDIGISYKHIADTNLAYRLYIRERWANDPFTPTWKHGEQPWWM